MPTSADLPPRDEPIKLLLGDIEITDVIAGLARVHWGRHESELEPHVWINGKARVNGTELDLDVQIHMPAGRAHRIAARVDEMASVAEKHHAELSQCDVREVPNKEIPDVPTD